jgi:hypothetical protein
VLNDPALWVYRSDLEVVTPTSAPGEKGTGAFVLIRRDGYVAARGRSGSMGAITGYLRGLFREPVCNPDERPEDSAAHPACGPVSGRSGLG